MAETTCLYCGKKFTKKVVWQKFCTPKCTGLWHNERRQKAAALLSELEDSSSDEIKLIEPVEETNDHE